MREQSSQILNSTLVCEQVLGKDHSHRQRLHSFWSAPRIIPLGGFITRSPWFTDFPSLCACSESSLTGWEQKEFSVHSQKFGPSQFLALIKRSKASGMRMDEDRKTIAERNTEEWAKQSEHAGHGSLYTLFLMCLFLVSSLKEITNWGNLACQEATFYVLTVLIGFIK